MDIHDGLYTPNLEFTGWKTGWPDFRMVPDPATARKIPWEEGVGSLLCNYTDWDGKAVDLAPRTILERVTERVRRVGFEPKVAVELEFFILRETSQSLETKNYSNVEFLTVGNHSYHPFRGASLLRSW